LSSDLIVGVFGFDPSVSLDYQEGCPSLKIQILWHRVDWFNVVKAQILWDGTKYVGLVHPGLAGTSKTSSKPRSCGMGPNI